MYVCVYWKALSMCVSILVSNLKFLLVHHQYLLPPLLLLVATGVSKGVAKQLKEELDSLKKRN